MRYLLDTCVVSEFTRARPEKRVIDWLNGQDQEQLYLSVVTLGEVQRGIHLLAPSNRRTVLEAWLSGELVTQFADRTLPLEGDTFLAWGTLVARLQQTGHLMGVFDSLIAATALHGQMTVVTRNVSDFQYAQVNVLNPWQA